MFDEIDRLRGVRELADLLAHYARLAAPDRQAWQDRLPAMDGLEPRALVRLHGELLAYGWLEQNTGAVSTTRGAPSACYRVTAAGFRALKDSQAAEAPAA